MDIPSFAVAGIPLIVIVFAIIEEIKAYGVKGKVLRLLSLVVGCVMAFLFQLSTAMPVTFADWLTVVVIGVVYGVAYGLTASGAYDFLDGRIAKV